MLDAGLGYAELLQLKKWRIIESRNEDVSENYGSTTLAAATAGNICTLTLWRVL